MLWTEQVEHTCSQVLVGLFFFSYGRVAVGGGQCDPSPRKIPQKVLTYCCLNHCKHHTTDERAMPLLLPRQPTTHLAQEVYLLWCTML